MTPPEAAARLPEEHHVRLEHSAAGDAVDHDEPRRLLQRHVPVRIHRRLNRPRTARPRSVRTPAAGPPAQPGISRPPADV